jgi:hypothetical protein
MKNTISKNKSASILQRKNKIRPWLQQILENAQLFHQELWMRQSWRQRKFMFSILQRWHSHVMIGIK